MKHLLLALAFVSMLCGQSSITQPDRIRNVLTAPTVGAACVNAQAMQRDVSAGTTSGHLFSCEASKWVDISTGGSSGNPFSAVGTFDNSASDFSSLSSSVNSCSLSADYTSGHGTAKATYAVGGCLKVPTTSTEVEAGGGFFSVTNNTASTNGVGMASSGFIGADGADTSHKIPVWGFNPLVSDLGHNHAFLLNELDFNVTGLDTHVVGVSMVGASTHAPDATSYAFLLGALGTGIAWPNGFACADGATLGTGACFQAGVQTTGNSQFSQVIQMLSRNSGGVTKKFAMVESPTADGSFFLDDATSTFIFNNNNATAAQAILTIGKVGAVTEMGAALASLAPTTNGTFVYCTDCLVNSVPCTASSTGAFAKRLNGAWRCD